MTICTLALVGSVHSIGHAADGVETGMSGQTEISTAAPPTPTSGAPGYLDPERRARLEHQGHSVTDIYTALSLEERSGIPLERWLAERRQGREWPAIIEELMQGRPLPKRRFSETARSLTYEEMSRLMDEGYALADISAAGSITEKYGSDPRDLLEKHQNGLAWEIIDEQEAISWREGQVDEVRGAVGDRPTGIEQLPKKDQAPKQPGLKTRTNLTTGELGLLLEAGLAEPEILEADRLAHGLGVNLRSAIVERRPGENLKDVVKRVEEKRPPSERAATLRGPHPNEEERLAMFAETTGLTETELRTLRTQGKSWVEITGVKAPDGGLTQYDLANAWGITDHLLVERATELGFSILDVRQAYELGKLTGRPPEDVLALKTSTNTWRDVVLMLNVDLR